MKVKKATLLIALFFGILAIGYIVWDSKKRSFVYDGFGVAIPPDYPIMGIDVSHHQGEINYQEAVSMHGAKDSIQFVYIKVTEGTDFKDSRYDQNAEGFAALGMNYGFYHYYQPNKSAEKQALFYCETIKNYNFKLIPVVDIEVIGDLNKSQLVDSISVFINRVDAILESRPMIYTYVSFFNDYFDGTDLDNELFWLASYNRKNPYMKKENAIIWQFSERGTVNGISTRVDLNVAKSTFNEKVIRKR